MKKIWFISCAALAIILTIFYVVRMPRISDVNTEAILVPITVAYIEKARNNGQDLPSFFATNSIFSNYKEEDSHNAYGFAHLGGGFTFEFMAYISPLLVVCYLPFVKILGLSTSMILWYSISYSLIAFILIGVLGWRFYGRWQALIAVALLATSLVWLIHVRQAYSPWMPSVGLLLLAVVFLDLYFRTKKGRYFVCGAIPVGLLYLTGWIGFVFGVIVIGWGWLLMVRERRGKSVVDLIAAVACSIGVVVLFIFIYAAFYRCSSWEIYTKVFAQLFGRYSMGAIPGVNPSIIGKILYACKCLFSDMTQFDHIDKCLPGKPAISWLFAFCFLAGFVRAIVTRSKQECLLLLWIVSVFGFFMTVFLYSHRYALLVLPAMALLASNAVVLFFRWMSSTKYSKVLPFAVVLFLAVFTYTATGAYRQFYTDFLLKKPPNFEEDRARGHQDFAGWLKATHSADNTVVVLGDPVMFGSCYFLFHTWGCPYDFKFWSNRVTAMQGKKDILEWEANLHSRYTHIVYAFSPHLMGIPGCRGYWNDWRPFLSVHPDARPVFVYRYADRQPSIIVFVVTRN